MKKELKNLSDLTLRLNNIYITYQGEVNQKGIGIPVIFLRLQGCPIRCYKRTMGTLCDTPEALDKDDKTAMPISAIVSELKQIRFDTGISYICLTGGDPLWHPEENLHQLFDLLERNDFEVSVETSGVISAFPYLGYKNVYWVIDYKLKSAGVKKEFVDDNYFLKEGTIIKFVVYDIADLLEAIKVFHTMKHNKGYLFTIGLYWGTSKLTYKGVFDYLVEQKLAGQIHINFQTHKLAEFYDANAKLASGTKIRVDI